MDSPQTSGTRAPRVRPGTSRARPGAPRITLRIIVIVYIGILVVVPLAFLVWRAIAPGLDSFVTAVTDPLTLHAFALTAEIAAISVVINKVFGVTLPILL